jgi:murein L,D-transpeptidase YcbB/YkuD
MRGPSVVAILGGGLLVVVAQLVVWLTPARDLIIDVPENPAALDASRTQVTEANESSPAEETVAQGPAPPDGEAKVDASPGDEEAPAPDEETAARGPAFPEAESDASPPSVEAAPVPAAETAAQMPNLPEAESEASPPGDEEAPPPDQETAAQAPALPEREGEIDATLQGDEEAPGPTEEAAAQGAAPSERKAEVNASPPGNEQAEEAVPVAPVLPDKLFIIDTIRRKLNDPALRKGAHADDLAALEAFYAGDDGPARWVTSRGLTPQAQAIIGEIAKADDWGLDASTFKLPPPDARPTVAEDQAAVEIALDVAILKYARAAQGGRANPEAVSRVFAQEPPLREPATVLTEIAAAPAPDAYLWDLQPKHVQFERLRHALLKVRAEGEAKPDELNKLRVNMERWRWTPAELGAIYVWLNIPEFMIYVIKDGKVIHSEKVVVGNPNSPTPVLSADLKSIVFNPDRIVPLSIIRKKVLPALQEGKTSVLQQYKLTVKQKGKPIDPTKIDWKNVNLAALTFVQAPGPTNTLGKVQFIFPNPRDISLHETIIPDQLERAVRALGDNSPRVGNPDKLGPKTKDGTQPKSLSS